MRETIVFIALMAVILILTVRCTPAELAQDAAASSYEAQQMRCVEQYAKKADIDACRVKVKLAWSTLDGGAQ